MFYIYISFFNFRCSNQEEYETFMLQKDHVERSFIYLLQKHKYLPLPLKKCPDTELFIEFSKLIPMCTIILAKYDPYKFFMVYNNGKEYTFDKEDDIIYHFTSYKTVGGDTIRYDKYNMFLNKLENIYDFDVEMST